MGYNKEIIQHANEVLRQANLNEKATKILQDIINANKKVQFFVTVQSIQIEHVNKKVLPIIIFSDIQFSTLKYMISSITRYSNSFTHLKQLKKGDKLELKGKVYNKGNYLKITNVEVTEYVAYPEDYVLRQVVPRNAQTRLGYALVTKYPPLTKPTGQIELNYPSQEREAILKYLAWLQRK